MGDALAALLLALPFLNPFSLIPSGIFGFTEVYLLTACLAPFLLAWLPLRGRQTAVRIVAWGWLLAAVLNSIIGLCQYFGVTGTALIAPAPLGDAGGNVRQTNILATLQVISLLALAWLWRTHALPFKRGILKNGLPIVLAATILTGLAATASRIGMVELFAVALMMTGYTLRPAENSDGDIQRRRSIWLALGVCLTAIVFYFIVTEILSLVLHGTAGSYGRNLISRWAYAENSCNSRFTLYGNVLHLISLKPWTGWGWGNLAWANFVTLYDGNRMCSPWMDNAHNLPLHLAVTLGIPAAVIICGAVLYVIWRQRPWRERDPGRQLAWGILLALGLHSMTEYPLWYGPFQVAVVICVALLWRPAACGADVRRRRTLWLCHGLAALLLATAGYAAWDYWRISQIFVPVAMRTPWWREDAVTPALKSRLFADQVRFGLVLGTPVTRQNAAHMLPMAILALHFGPNTSVIGAIVESAALLGHAELAATYLKRFQLAMPAECQKWTAEHADLAGRLQSVSRP
jgi:O-antigen ligase